MSIPNRRRAARVSGLLQPDETVLFTGRAHWLEWSQRHEGTGDGVLVVTDRSMHYANDFVEDLRRTIPRAEITSVDVKPFAHVFQLIVLTRTGETVSFAGRPMFLFALKYDFEDAA